MRRLSTSTVLLALAACVDPVGTKFRMAPQGVSVPVADGFIKRAHALVDRYGHLVSDRKHPAELARLATQRQRARQTHPGKRGRA